MSWIYVNDELTAQESARIPIDDRGFRYGDSIFDTIPVHGGVPYLLEYHMQRTQTACRELSLPVNLSKMSERIKSLISRNNVQEGIVRTQISSGSGGRGYARPENVIPLTIIESVEWKQQPSKAITLWSSHYRKIPVHSLPVTHKLGHGINSMLALQDAHSNHCDDSLMLGQNGHLCESSSSNIFWEKDGVLFTPSLDCGVLDGVMRRRVIELSPLPVKQGCYFVGDLLRANAVFLTNSVKKIQSVSEVIPYGRAFNEEADIIQSLQAIVTADIVDYSKQCTL